MGQLESEHVTRVFILTALTGIRLVTYLCRCTGSKGIPLWGLANHSFNPVSQEQGEYFRITSLEVVSPHLLGKSCTFRFHQQSQGGLRPSAALNQPLFP